MKIMKAVTMKTRADIAKDYFKSGFNCSQSVAMAFCDLMNMSEDTASKLTVGFGGGMGRMREVCGAVSGMTFVISALYADRGTAEVYSLVQQAAGEFKNENGSIVCRELLEGSKNSAPSTPVPSKRTNEYYKKRPCPELVYEAADILERLIKENAGI